MYPVLNDIIELIDEEAPFSLAEPWDNPGLQVGNPNIEIQKILVSLDPTFKAVQAASVDRYQLLLTHHPLIFSPISSLNTSIYPGNVIFECIKNNVAVVSAHTNLDAAPGGISYILASMLNLKHKVPLKPSAVNKEAGIGCIGEIDPPLNLTDLKDLLEKALGLKKLSIVYPQDKYFKRLAIVGGSGGSLIKTAWEKGAEVLVTGDVGHHHALDSVALGITLIDAGHFGTERPAFYHFAKKFEQKMKSKGWKTSINFFEDEQDPIINVLN